MEMDYFQILNLHKEPFSNSPDPDFFFKAQPHADCLQKMELSIRLRRGLSVVLGDVGTGKTTLCRELIRKFASDDRLETHLVLDPSYNSPSEFLSAMAKMFGGHEPIEGASELEIKENIKKYLFRRGVDEKKSVLLVIDEGQKLPALCLEILREFLNYETNEYKLLQIVIFAQGEFKQVLFKHQNFADRVNWTHRLRPFNFRETRAMIHYRLARASKGNGNRSFFGFPALWAIYRATGGYPRKIIHLCHRIILTLIIQNQTRASWFLVRACARRVFQERPKRGKWIWIGALGGALACLMVLGIGPGGVLPLLPRFGTTPQKPDQRETITLSQKMPIQIPNRPLEREKSGPTTPVTPPVALEETSEKAPEGVSASQDHGSQTRIRSESPENSRPEMAGKASLISPEKGTGELSEKMASSTAGIEPASSSQQRTREDEFPEWLGQIAIARKETLSEMIHKIYGIFTNQYLAITARANPHIMDINELPIGHMIRFPAIPLPIKPLSLKHCWVVIAQEDKLDNAYRFLRRHPDDFPPLYMIPYWNSREGLKFLIVQKQPFPDEEAAREGLQRLPPGLIHRARILAEWDEDTVFFADPAFYIAGGIVSVQESKVDWKAIDKRGIC